MLSQLRVCAHGTHWRNGEKHPLTDLIYSKRQNVTYLNIVSIYCFLIFINNIIWLQFPWNMRSTHVHEKLTCSITQFGLKTTSTLTEALLTPCLKLTVVRCWGVCFSFCVFVYLKGVVPQKLLHKIHFGQGGRSISDFLAPYSWVMLLMGISEEVFEWRISSKMLKHWNLFLMKQSVASCI